MENLHFYEFEFFITIWQKISIFEYSEKLEKSKNFEFSPKIDFLQFFESSILG